MRFEVADATELAGYDGQFHTIIDSALYHCLDHDGRRLYAAALYRATTPDARWFLYCFSGDNVNGVIAPMEAVPENDIRNTLGNAGWHIDFLGPTTFVGNTAGFTGNFGKLPGAILAADAARASRTDAPYGRKDGHNPSAHRRRTHPLALQRCPCDQS